MRADRSRSAGAACLSLLVVLVMISSSSSAVYAPGTLADRAAEAGLPQAGIWITGPHTTATPIQHVVIIIQENHAFDNYFSQFPGVFGLPPGGVPEPSTYGNVTGYGNQYTVGWSYGGNQSSGVPAHDVENIDRNMDNGTMDGYDYTDTQTADAVYPSYIVPNELGLGQEYGVGDDYFHAYAGPTTPNRFYYYADTSGQVTTNPGIGTSVQTTTFPTMPQELSQNGISWGDFDGDYNYNNYTSCNPLLFTSHDWPYGPSCYFFYSLVQLMPSLYFDFVQQYAGQMGHLQPADALFSDLYSGNLPAVSWYTQDWLNGTEHPGTIAGIGGNVTQGQQGIVGIIRAIENSPYWSSTAIFLSYDEGGGFFDHTPPPQVSALGDGVRMPFIVISPYAKEGYVSHAYYTPSSLLHFIEYNWNLPPLGALDGTSNIPLDFFNFSATPRAPLPQSVWGEPNALTAFPWSYTQPVSTSFIGTYKPALVANGNVSWALPTQNNILNSPALTPDGSILYETGMDGYVRAVDPVFGTQDWGYSLGAASRSTPAILPGDGVLASTLRGGLTAYSSSGSLLWNLSLGAPIYGGLTLAEGNYYGGLTNGSAFEVSANGSLVWWKTLSQEGIYAPPAFDPSDSMLMFSARSSGVVATDLAGATQWTAGVPGGVFATGAVSGGTLYVVSMNQGLYPVTSSSGAIGTEASFPGPGLTTPTISGSTLYVANSTGGLYSYSLPSLSLAGSAAQYCGSAGSPVVWGNQLVSASECGFVYSYPLTLGAATSVLHTQTSLYGGPISTPVGLYFGGEDGELYASVTGGWLHLGLTPTTSLVTVGGAPVTLTAGKAALGLAAGSVSVVASAPGYITQTVSVTVPKGGSVWKNITLSPSTVSPGTLAGTVTNSSNGATLSSVNVLVEPTGAIATSGTGGAYTLSLSAGTYSLFVNATDYKPFLTNGVVISSSQTTSEPIALTPLKSGGGGVTPGTLTGSVLNQTNNNPVVGVTVTIEPGAKTITTSATGAFTLSLAPSTYSIFINATGYNPYFQTGVVITTGQTNTQTILLVPQTTGSGNLGVLAGTVVNATNGQSVASAAITITLDNSGVSVASATTSAAGAFTIGSLNPGAYAIYVNATGYDPYFGSGLVVSAGHTTNVPVSLTPVVHTSPTKKQGSSTPINWLLWGLVLTVVLAAAILVAAVVIHNRRKKQELPPEMMAVDQVAAGGAVPVDPYAVAPPMTSDGLPPAEESAPDLNSGQ